MSQLPFNLVVDAFIPINTGERREWVTLPYLLAMKTPARIDHPMSALNTPLLMMVTALTQHQQDAIGGFSRDQIHAALADGSELTYQWLDKPLKTGLDLFGDAAFMQIPEQWVKAVVAASNPKSPFATRSPEGLLKPFRTDGGKALRLPKNRIDGICPSCAATALFFKNSFTTPMAQYWGRSSVAGMLVVMHQAIKGRAFDMPLTVALNLTSNEKFEDYPWHSGEESLLKAICTPVDNKLTQSASLLPLIRAQRLVEPTETGTCDCCERSDQHLITKYYEIGEKTLFGALSVEEKISISENAIVKDEVDGKVYTGKNILSSMYADINSRRHPNVPFCYDKEGKHSPIVHSEGFDDPTQQAPTWTRFSEILAKGSMPTMQNLETTKATVRGLKKAVARQIAQQLYTIVPESGTNPNPKFIADDTYSFICTDDSLHITENIRKVVQEVTIATGELIQIISDSIAFLFKEVNIDHDSLNLRSDSFLNPNGTAKRLASVRTAAAHLWNDAFIQINRTADEIRGNTDISNDYESITLKQITALEASAKMMWKMVEKTEFSRQSDARDLYRQSRASKNFSKLMAERSKHTAV